MKNTLKLKTSGTTEIVAKKYREWNSFIMDGSEKEDIWGHAKIKF